MREIATWPEGQEFTALQPMMRITLSAILRALFGAEGRALREASGHGADHGHAWLLPRGGATDRAHVTWYSGVRGGGSWRKRRRFNAIINPAYRRCARRPCRRRAQRRA